MHSSSRRSTARCHRLELMLTAFGSAASADSVRRHAATGCAARAYGYRAAARCVRALGVRRPGGGDRARRQQAGRRFGRFGAGQHHLLPAEHHLQRALHPHRRGHDDRPAGHAVGRHGARPAVPHRSGGAHRRPLPDRQGQRHRRPLLASTSATTCGPATTSTSPIRTTATRTSPGRSRSRRSPSEPVVIGDGSWLGYGTVVLPGARIGRHVTVGANSVVTGEMPDYCVAVGAPGQGDPPLRRRRGLGASRAVAVGAQASPPSSPGGMQCGIALPVVKSMTCCVTGPPSTSVSRYGSQLEARAAERCSARRSAMIMR